MEKLKENRNEENQSEGNCKDCRYWVKGDGIQIEGICRNPNSPIEANSMITWDITGKPIDGPLKHVGPDGSCPEFKCWIRRKKRKGGKG